MNNKICSCFFPTKTLFIDDSKDFLNGLSLSLSSDDKFYECFTDAKSALETISKNDDQYYWYKKYLNNLDEEEIEKKILEVNIYDLHKQIYNKKRFSVITSVVVDYDMPKINGIDFCQEIKNDKIYKIMLTGVADENIAVKAFNDGIIQAFVKKSSPNVYEEIEKYIQKGAHRYFDKVSKAIFTSIDQEDHSDFLKDSGFVEFFEKILKDYNISEFYLLEGNGSYLLLDKDGKEMIFYLVPEEEIEQLYEDILEIGFSSENLNSLQKKEKVFCNLSVDDLDQFDDINDSVLDAKAIKIGNKQYYYAFRQMRSSRKQILTFKQFLQRQR